MPGLNIATNLTLPLDFVTSAQAILARRRSGKSYCASVQAEELLKAHQQICVIDPTGAWHGLRSSADGLKPGYPIVVFGGEHGDAPLEATAGAMLAQAVVEKQFSAIFDVSLLGVAAAVRFVADFCDKLFMLNRDPLHLFVDEADAYAPQKPFGDEAKSLHALTRLVKQGGIRGLGITLITQRPQNLAKNVVSQVDMLTVLRMSHPLDIKAVTDWVESEVSVEFAKDMKGALPGLPIGTAFVCSAPWHIAKRVEIRKRETFNSGATPKPGERKQSPKVLAPVDIKALGTAIAETAERAKADDPKALRAKIAQLEARPIPGESELNLLHDELASVNAKNAEFQEFNGRLVGIIEEASKLLRTIDVAEYVRNIVEAPRFNRPLIGIKDQVNVPALPSKPVATRTIRPSSGSGQPLPKAERSILTVLAQHGPSAKSRIAALSGYSVGGGGFNNALSALRTKGFLVGSDPCNITQDGIDALGQWEPLPSGRDLLNFWLGRLPKAERGIVEALANHRRSLTKDELGELTGYASSGGGFNNALSHLRTLELIHGSGMIGLTPDFAEAIQ